MIFLFLYRSLVLDVGSLDINKTISSYSLLSMLQKRALILTNHMVEFGGSEVVALHVACTLHAMQFSVDLHCNVLGNPLQDEIPDFIRVSDSDVLPNPFEYDLVWAQHTNLALALSQNAIPPSWSTLILSVHLSPHEPMELAAIATARLVADLFVANSFETFEELKAYGLSENDIYVFRNACPSEYCRPPKEAGGLKKVLIVSNHPPEEVFQAADLLRATGIIVTHIGQQSERRLVTPDVLAEYDATITIGRTVQYCLLGHMPVYVYDHFGGPGWLLDNNCEKAERFNYSGRCTRQKKTSNQIADEIIAGYALAQAFAREGRLADRYILEDVLKNIVQRKSQRLRPMITQQQIIEIKAAAVNSAIIRREYRLKEALLHERKNILEKLEATTHTNSIKVASILNELETSRATNATLRNELDVSRTTSARLRDELDAVYLSKSWRITHSLRVIATRVYDIMNFGRRARNAIRYLLRGDLPGLRRRISTIRKDRVFEEISKGVRPNGWCILTTPHTIFIANSIASRLQLHGFVVDIRLSAPDEFVHDMYIVLCPQMFKKLPPGERRISFQLEQSVSSRWFNDDYFEVLEGSFAVFDYSLKNIEFLSRHKIIFPHVHYVPIGAISNYIPASGIVKKSYDVLFYGDASSSPRRRKMLNAIRRNFNLHECSEIFGMAMAEEIKKARVVINIHYYENALLEMPRIQECISLGVPVVSESAQDKDEYPEIEGAVSFFEEGNEQAMIEAIHAALDDLPKLEAGIDLAVRRSEFRYAFMLDRALVALSLLPSKKIIDNDLPVPNDATHITLSMPETIHRRRVYEENKPNGYFIFDGLRARPGWVGCGLSYKALAVHGIKNNLSRLTVIEDDVLLPEDFEIKLQNVFAYLDLNEGFWDVFAGVVATLHENTKIIKCEEFGGMTFLTLDKMTSMVCNIYSRRGMHILASWDQDDKNDQTNTIDKHIERPPNLRVVVALPFLVGHREEVYSTLWGFQNTTYSSLIANSERDLYQMLNEFKKKFPLN